MADKWIPNYIKKSIDYKPRDILSAQEYNALLNLIITQGDYNSSWLLYLQNEAIPEAIREIGEEEIAQVLTQAVQEAIAALASSVINKTSAQLNNPMVTILNTGMQLSGIVSLKTLIEAKNLYATYAVATNFVGLSSAYPSLAQLNTLKGLGNDIVAYSTDGSPVTTLTMDTVVPAAHTYMDTNGFNADVFVYPDGNSDVDVQNAVCGTFKYAVNTDDEGAIIPDGILETSPAGILGNLAVIKIDDTIDVDDIKDIIDDAVQYNKYIIFWVNTDSVNYSTEVLGTIIDYVQTKTNIIYPSSITDAMNMIHETIGNSLLKLDGISVTEVNGVKYLNW